MTSEQGPGRDGAPPVARAHGLDPVALRRTSAPEQVADRLTALILDGTLLPGDRLPESTLAASLGISRNSVREGIRLLERGRLVRSEMHRGAVVATPSVADLDDLYTARHRLEELAAGLPDDGGRDQALEAAYARLEAAAATRDARTIVEADMAFHATIVARLGSERLDAFFAQVITEMGYYLRILSHTDDEPGHADDAVLAQHRVLVDAIRAGDAAAARAAVAEHLAANHRRIRDILAERAAAGPR
ncbi:GntR family transcriptional regulator [Agrococcus terreus]|uniref:HTH gntR-type domain-containing protein n=1 Tax=Agrococcus terreus TaxID=574649 RepID=A0ABQ2KBW5_9MICO|nr:GntR family transcriptional regulator [Agrococcus terreus]GGN78035.1 hypothetical protein GCM10010968_03380 [Agrococcus terreus]